MVTRIEKTVESDLSGEPGATTVEVSLEGDLVSIDLTAEEKAKLQRALKRYFDKGRKVHPASRAGKRSEAADEWTVPVMTREEREEIRDWGKLNGFKVSDFGRLPRDLILAYDEEHGIDTTTRDVDRTRAPGEEPPRVRPITTRDERERIRDWGTANGFKVSHFGKLPNDLILAYDEAHGTD